MLSARTVDPLPVTTKPSQHGKVSPAWLILSQKGENTIQWIPLLNTVTLGNSKRDKKKKKRAKKQGFQVLDS